MNCSKMAVSRFMRKSWNNVIRDLLQAEAPEEVIKSLIRPETTEGQVLLQINCPTFGILV